MPRLVLRGVEGYGETAGIHKVHLTRRDRRPILITVVDTAENLDRLTPVVEKMTHTGLLAASDVEVIRVQEDAACKQGASSAQI
jgi:PII-like signaling protein